MTDSECWAGPLTPAERRVLAAMLGRARLAYRPQANDGSYAFALVTGAAAECRVLYREVSA